eukprot:Pgem_evm1s1375
MIALPPSFITMSSSTCEQFALNTATITPDEKEWLFVADTVAMPDYTKTTQYTTQPYTQSNTMTTASTPITTHTAVTLKKLGGKAIINPKSPYNLLSIPILDDIGYETKIKNGTLSIYYDGKLLITGRKQNRLYKMNMRTVSTENKHALITTAQSHQITPDAHF